MAQSSKSPAERAQQSVADLTIEAFAHDEGRLQHALDVYRDLAQTAMTAWMEEKSKRKWYQRECYRLRDEQRWRPSAERPERAR